MTEAAAAMLEVDRLAGLGDLRGAASLLEAQLEGEGWGAEPWLQLAGLRRALRQPHRALDAVHRALEASPLNFMGLVMRAGLLERLGDDSAGEAWVEALAQRPEGPLPPALDAAVVAGAASAARWTEERENRLRAATALAEAEASGDIAWRIGRFRDNALRRTKIYHSSPTQYHYPGLTEREFYPRERFPWLEDLEALSGVICAEMRATMQSQRAELAPYIQYPAHSALDQWRSLNHNPDWTAVHLIKRGGEVEANAQQCPQTMAFLRSIAQPHVAGASPNAMFSLLAPRTTIPPHVGVNNTRLLCHLPLVVPQGCWFRVGAETRPWREGEAFVFDDTVEHEAGNPSEALRVVLIFDLWHPDLSAIEREAVAALVGAECGPD